MKEFRCSCIGCGRKPEFGVTEIWVESKEGMLCEACWRKSVYEYKGPTISDKAKESEHCCFCSLCKRRPPDPDYKIWIETEKGCLCEKCWKEIIGKLLAERIEPAILEKRFEKSGPLDVQLGCCLLNKKLLNNTLNNLPQGEYLEISVDNVDIMKTLVKKFIAPKGCTIININDKNGTSVLTIKKL